jgi:hypothetical protein
MTRKLNKKIWPYSHVILSKVDEDNFNIDDEIEEAREKWLLKIFNENIRNRVYIVEHSKGLEYYFQREEDYAWFVWRWA